VAPARGRPAARAIAAIALGASGGIAGCATSDTGGAAAAPGARPATMQAIVMREYGGPEVLQLERMPVPEPAAGQLRLRIVAAAVNPVDSKRRQGRFRPPPPPGATGAGAPAAPAARAGPLIPGFDAAGTVDAVGPGVAGFRKGDAVFAGLHRAPQGAYAEYAVVAAEDVAPKPPALDFAQAAGLVTGGVTALRAIAVAEVRAGQRVLVQGGAGGVGTPLVQILRTRGATVIATASARNAGYLKELGVHEVVDYTAGRFEDAVAHVDAVIDTVGGEVTARSASVVRPGGVLVSIASPPPAAECAHARIRCPAFVPAAQPMGLELRELAGLVAAGQLRVHVDRVLPLAEAAEAQRLIETGRTRGKIVLSVP
jgi:NADPH:quinone reductase-like Zn-dependent oxidoreductase